MVITIHPDVRLELRIILPGENGYHLMITDSTLSTCHLLPLDISQQDINLAIESHTQERRLTRKQSWGASDDRKEKAALERKSFASLRAFLRIHMGGILDKIKARDAGDESD